MGVDWNEFIPVNREESDWVEVDWVEINWVEVDWIGFEKVFR